MHDNTKFPGTANVCQTAMVLGIIVGVFFSSLGSIFNFFIPLISKLCSCIFCVYLLLVISVFLMGIYALVKFSMYSRKIAMEKEESEKFKSIAPFLFGVVAIGIPSWLNLCTDKNLLTFSVQAANVCTICPWDVMLGGIMIPLFAGFISIKISKPEPMIKFKDD